jgi:hypothetical protein
MDTSEAREWLFPKLRSLAESVQNGEIPLVDACKRGGIGQDLSEYGTSRRRAGPLYRGAKYANEHIDGVTIQRGDKPALVYIERVADGYPRIYDATTAEDGDPVDAVALNNPDDLPDGFVIDYDSHWTKVKAAMKPLLDTRFGANTWSDVLHQHEQSGLSAFEQVGD